MSTWAMDAPRAGAPAAAVAFSLDIVDNDHSPMQTARNRIKRSELIAEDALYTAPIIPRHPKIDPCGLMSTSSSPYGKRSCR